MRKIDTVRKSLFNPSYFPTYLSLLIFAVIVSLGITGSSSGVYWQYLNSGSDPRLLFGNPNAGRSDEWFVQTPWVIGQITQGFPEFNGTLPGGMSAVIPFDLPNTDWSTLFKPELWGFFFLPIDQAWSWKWFLPFFLLFNSVYAFAFLFLRGNRFLAVVLSLFFCFSPFIQAWFLANTFFAPIWAFTFMSAALVFLQERKLRLKLFFGFLLTYFSVVLAMGTYVPFALAVAYASLAFVIAAFFSKYLYLDSSRKFLLFIKDLFPLLLAGVIAVGLIWIWVLNQSDQIRLFLATSYPGIRFESAGSGSWKDGLSILSAPASAISLATDGAPFGPNFSESSSFVLIGFVLLLPLIYWQIKYREKLKRFSAFLIALLGMWVVISVFLFVPGWDNLAHILFLDRVTVARYRFSLGMINFLFLILFLRNLVELQKTTNKVIPNSLFWGTLSFGTLLFIFPEIWFVRTMGIGHLFNWTLWLPALLLFAALFLMLKLRPKVSIIIFTAASLLLMSQINPIYKGVFDLRETKLSQEILDLSKNSNPVWLGLDLQTLVPSAVLVESGVTALNGFQGVPPKETWNIVDPNGDFVENWNRLGRISWVPGQGEPVISNPAADVISVSFDSCSKFAQSTVTYVMSDGVINQPCLELLKVNDEYPQRFFIYRVTSQT